MNVPIKHLADTDRHLTKSGGISDIPSLEHLRIRLYLVLVIADIGGLLLGFALASLAYNGGMIARGAMLEAQLMLPVYLTIALYNGSYSRPSLEDLRLACLRVAVALFLAAALVNLIAFYLKANAQFSRVMFTFGLCFSMVILVAIRMMLRRYQQRWFGPTLQNILLIDAGGPKIAMRDAYQINAGEHGLSASLTDPHGLDRLGQAIRHMDRVLVSCPPEARKDWGLVLRAAAVDGEVISHNAHDLVAIGVRRHEGPDGDDFSTLVVSSGPLNLQHRIVKRLFDIGFSIASLTLLSPLMLAAAAATLIEDGRPILFRQRRLGKANRFFHIVKFRSMRANDSDVDGTRSTTRDDERLTKTGRFLRSWSIDELPSSGMC